MLTRGADTNDTVWFAFAGGGTGGHLFPALALAEAIRARRPRAAFQFFTTRRRIEDRILQRTECEWIPQSLQPLSSRPWRWPALWSSFRRTRLVCRNAFALHRPLAVVGTGGLASVPAMLEAVRLGIPTIVFNPDAIPGKANRSLARRADLFIAQWEQTRRYVSPRVAMEVLGCPVRSGFFTTDRAGARRRFSLDPARKTLLITGASQGARTINEAVMANLPWIAALSDWQLLHLTGEADFAAVEEAYRRHAVQGLVLPFTEHMADALKLADLVIGRAGASTLAEFTAVGRASILMPYPFHRDRHQTANARCLVDAGAAILVDDAGDVTRNERRLREALETMLHDDARRSRMAESARRLGRPEAADRIADRMLELLEALPVRSWRSCGNGFAGSNPRS